MQYVCICKTLKNIMLQIMITEIRRRAVDIVHNISVLFLCPDSGLDLVGGMSSDDSAGGCGNSSSSSSLSDGEVLPLPTPPVPDNSDTTGLRRQQLDAGTDPGQHHHHDHLQQALQAAVSHSPVVNGGSIPPLGMESQAAFMRRSFHKNPRLPGTYRLSKLNGCSRLVIFSLTNIAVSFT